VASPEFDPSSDYEVASTSGAGTFAVNVPASVGDGDLLMAVLISNGSDEGNNSLPAAFGTPVQSDDQGSSNAAEIAIGLKIASSEPASYTFTNADGGKAVGLIARITGHHATAYLDASGKNTGSGTTPQSPAVTATVADTLRIRITTERQAQDVSSFPESNDQIDEHSAAGNRCGIGICTAPQASAGSTGTADWTLDSSENWAAFTIVIAPPSAAGEVYVPQFHYMRRAA